MATFGPIASAAPNVLFNPMAVDQAVQGTQRNRLMMEQGVEDQAFQRQTRQQHTFKRDAEARIGWRGSLSDLPEPEAAAQWGPAASAAGIRARPRACRSTFPAAWSACARMASSPT
jgi:hypothetical protein